MSDLTYYDVMDLHKAGKPLSGLYLWRIDLSDALLDYADFSRSVLADSILRGARLMHVSFVDADLRATDFTGADLTGANLTGAQLQGAIFTSANLTGVRF